MLLHPNPGLSFFSSPLWTLGHHHYQFTGGHWKIHRCFVPFRVGIFNAGFIHESTFLREKRFDWRSKTVAENHREQKWRKYSYFDGCHWEIVFRPFWITSGWGFADEWGFDGGLDGKFVQSGFCWISTDGGHCFDQLVDCYDEWHLSTNSGN